MTYTQVLKTTVVTSGKGGISGGGFTITPDGSSEGGGGEDSGESDDFTYVSITDTNTFGSSDLGSSAIPVFDLPTTVDISQNKGMLWTIETVTKLSSDPGTVPVFLEVSHDGTNWSSYTDSATTHKITVLADLDLTRPDGTVEVLWVNTEDMRFPQYRFGFNSGGVNLDGYAFKLGYTFVDKWVDPAKYRKWLTKPGE
jgi:hypothetical protein